MSKDKNTELYKRFLEIADKSVKETVDMFFKYPSGFHGDTGLQHYLYHRIVTNAGSAIHWRPTETRNVGTLLFQSEVSTEMSYRKTEGAKSSPGRFDLAFVAPPTNEDLMTSERLKALIAFEVGRNKKIKRMGDFRAPEEVRDLKPGDAAKIIRDLRFGSLNTGYILQFFDKSTLKNIQNAQEIAKELSCFIRKAGNIKCRIVISLFDQYKTPRVWLDPSGWANNLNMEYQQFDIEQQISIPVESTKNRIRYKEFLELCGDCGRALQEVLHKKYSKELRFVYGGKTMTVNLRPSKNCILRISNKFSERGEKICDFSEKLENIFVRNRTAVSNGKVSIPLDKDERFIHLILQSISEYLGQVEDKEHTNNRELVKEDKLIWERASMKDDVFDLRVKNPENVNVAYLQNLLEAVEKRDSGVEKNFDKNEMENWKTWLNNLKNLWQELPESAYAVLNNWAFGKGAYEGKSKAIAAGELWDALFCVRPERRMTDWRVNSKKLLTEEFNQWWPKQLKCQEDC